MGYCAIGDPLDQLWGDSPQDILDIAVKVAAQVFRADVGRPPTYEEVEGHLDAALRSYRPAEALEAVSTEDLATLEEIATVTRRSCSCEEAL